MSNYTLASKEVVLQWIIDGIFTVCSTGQIHKGNRILTPRVNKRRGMEGGDLRVDLRYKNKRRSVNVSHLVWMDNTHKVIPQDFEIHHRDEDSSNNSWNNLLCVHSLDHQKLHNSESIDAPSCRDVPF